LLETQRQSHGSKRNEITPLFPRLDLTCAGMLFENVLIDQVNSRVLPFDIPHRRAKALANRIEFSWIKG